MPGVAEGFRKKKHTTNMGTQWGKLKSVILENMGILRGYPFRKYRMVGLLLKGDLRITWGVSRFPDIALGPDVFPPDAQTRSDAIRNLAEDSGIRRKKAAAEKWPKQN